MERFAGWVKTDLILEKQYFNFHAIPDFIIEKKITKKDYEVVNKLLLKVKSAYINYRRELSTNKTSKKIEDESIT